MGLIEQLIAQATGKPDDLGRPSGDLSTESQILQDLLRMGGNTIEGPKKLTWDEMAKEIYKRQQAKVQGAESAVGPVSSEQQAEREKSDEENVIEAAGAEIFRSSYL